MDCFTHHNLIYMQKKTKLKFWILKVKYQKLFGFLIFLNKTNAVGFARIIYFILYVEVFNLG